MLVVVVITSLILCDYGQVTVETNTNLQQALSQLDIAENRRKITFNRSVNVCDS